MEVLEPLLAGPTAIAYSFEDPSAPAKVATKVAKGEKKFVIKGGCLDGRLLDAKAWKAFSAAANPRCGLCSWPHCWPSRRISSACCRRRRRIRVSAFSARGSVEGD